VDLWNSGSVPLVHTVHCELCLGTHWYFCTRWCMICCFTTVDTGVANCQPLDGQHTTEPRREHVLSSRRRTRQFRCLSTLALPIPPLTHIRRPSSKSTTTTRHRITTFSVPDLLEITRKLQMHHHYLHIHGVDMKARQCTRILWKIWIPVVFLHQQCLMTNIVFHLPYILAKTDTHCSAVSLR